MDDLALGLECPTCMAQPGERCVSKNGRQTYEVHVSRMKPLTEAYTLGLENGLKTAEHEMAWLQGYRASALGVPQSSNPYKEK